MGVSPAHLVAARKPNQPILRARNIGKSYRLGEEDLTILKQADLSVRPGEFVAIEGRSGSGKSTLLHILGGLDTPTTGAMEFEGVEYRSRPSNFLASPLLAWLKKIHPLTRMIAYAVAIATLMIAYKVETPLHFGYLFLAEFSILVAATAIAVGSERGLLYYLGLWICGYTGLRLYLGPHARLMYVIGIATGSALIAIISIINTYLAERAICNLRNKQFGFVFQFYHLLPELNVLENTLLAPLIEDPLAKLSIWRLALYYPLRIVLELTLVATLLRVAWALWLAFGFVLGQRDALAENSTFKWLRWFAWGYLFDHYRWKKRETKSRAVMLLESLGMGHRLRHKPNQLSGGERQRVAIARALMNQPKVLFADEPTGNLDYETGRQIMSVLEKLHRENNQTIIMVTHDRTLASQADRVLVLRDGRLEKPGETSGADKTQKLDYHSP